MPEPSPAASPAAHPGYAGLLRAQLAADFAAEWEPAVAALSEWARTFTAEASPGPGVAPVASAWTTNHLHVAAMRLHEVREAWRGLVDVSPRSAYWEHALVFAAWQYGEAVARGHGEAMYRLASLDLARMAGAYGRRESDSRCEGR